MFVHVRAKLYRGSGHQVKVFLMSDRGSEYQYEGISIYRWPKALFEAEINRFNPDVVAIFYATFWMIPAIRRLAYPKVVWILGHEVLWAFRLLASRNLLDWVKKRVVLLPRLTYQLLSVRKLLFEVEQSIFVSNWLLEAAEKNLLAKFEHAAVIPNPVDTQMFSYLQPEKMMSGLSLRSLERSIYGLDVAIKAFAKMEGASLTICGRGRFAKRYAKMISNYNSNTRLQTEYIQHTNLPRFFRGFGFFVAPSRQESQGLAMCEAMSCGLPVVASRVGGIPEYVRDGVDGYLVPPNDPDALRDGITRLLSDKDRFLSMSRNAREHIEMRCNPNVITTRELEVMRKAVDSYNDHNLQQHRGDLAQDSKTIA